MRWRAVLGAALLGGAILLVVLARPTPVLFVRLRTGGAVLLDGKAVSLAGLCRACGGKSLVALRVEEAVPWAHVEWVMMALQAAGVRDVRFDLPDGPVMACADSDYWKQDARGIPDGHFAGLLEVQADELADPGLPRRLAEETARIARDCRLSPLAHVFPEAAQPFAVVASALRALRDARLELELPFAGFVGGEVPDVSTLPPPPDLPAGSEQYAGWQCGCRPGIVDVDLPVADQGERDAGSEQDDRLFIHLDRDGRLFCNEGRRSAGRPEERNLDDLAALLRGHRERYDVKMKQYGRSGLDEWPGSGPVSRLYVLIRADRAAPARQVGWVLHVLAQEGFYKVQFAVIGEVGTQRGPCVGMLDRKIQLFLPTDGPPGIVGSDDPAVHVYVGPEAYGVGAARGLDAEGLRMPLAEAFKRAWADPSRTIVAAVHVAPGVAWERVITAANQLTRVGFEKVDFAGLEPPDAATRLLSPLPR